MEREDISKFTNSVILLSKLFITVEDKFLKQKLHSKISDFVSAFVEQKSVHVAQPGFHNAESIVKSRNIVQHGMSHNVAPQNLLNSINNLVDYLEHLAHTSKNDTTPLLLAQRNLLKFKLHILQQRKKSKTGKTSDIHSPKALTSDTLRTSDVVDQSSRPVVRKPNLKSDSNKERIFNYIKKTPEVRARDVLNEFSALSGRTVKRSLKELADEGFLKKVSDGGAVYYLPTE